MNDAGDDFREVSWEIDAVELAGFNERDDDGPVVGAAIRAGEEWCARWRRS